MKEKKKEVTEEVTLDPEEIEKKKKRKTRLIVFLILFFTLLVVAIWYTHPFFLIGKKNRLKNDENLKYLVDTYGETLRISFYTKKKKIWTYHLCSKKTPFCTDIKYNGKKWSYPKGENFIYTVLFMDEATDILDNNNINYTLYTDNETPLVLPNNFIVVVEKDDTSALINAITSIDQSSLISRLAPEKKHGGKYEFNIFNKDDYKIITDSIKENYNVSGYEALYKILYDLDKNEFYAKLGNNIQRHYIDYTMFDCTADNCGEYKHIAYRYVIGNHKYVGNTMILEGIRDKNNIRR